MGDKKLQAVTKLHCLHHKKVLTEHVQLHDQMRLLFRQNYVPPLFALLFFLPALWGLQTDH